MQARMPTVLLESDNSERVGTTEPFLMARSGSCMGMSEHRAVWRFGQLPNSGAAAVYGIYSKDFTWVLADRKTGEVISSWKGSAIRMPDEFRAVLNWGD